MSEFPLVIYGCGSQGQSILEWYREANPTQQISLADDNPALWGTEIDGLQVYRPELLLAAGPHRVMVTIGDNAIRGNLLLRLREQGHNGQGFRHPTAVVAPSAKVAEDAILLARVVVNTAASIGTGCLVNSGSIVEHHCCVERFAHLAPGTVLGGGVSIHEGAFLGLGAAVLPGLTVGRWATVGAGSLVRQHVPARAVVAGSPARLLRVREGSSDCEPISSRSTVLA